MLLHAWRAWGERLRQHVIGDYAFVVADVRTRPLFAARSHPGWRPLFFAKIHAGVLVASSIDALAYHPEVPKTPCDAAVSAFLAFRDQGRGDPGTHSVARVRRVSSGGAVVFDTCSNQSGVASIWLWGHCVSPDLSLDSREVPGQFFDLVKEATRDRLWPREASILLSGGIDSSMVACCARNCSTNEALTEIVAFTASQPEHPLMLDEEAAARLVAARLNLPCRLMELRAHPFLRSESRFPDLSIYPGGERMDAFQAMFSAVGPSVSMERWETRCECEMSTWRSRISVGRDLRSFVSSMARIRLVAQSRPFPPRERRASCRPATWMLSLPG